MDVFLLSGTIKRSPFLSKNVLLFLILEIDNVVPIILNNFQLSLEVQ